MNFEKAKGKIVQKLRKIIIKYLISTRYTKFNFNKIENFLLKLTKISRKINKKALNFFRKNTIYLKLGLRT